MKKILKLLVSLILLLFVSIGIYYFATNEQLPEGKQGKEADALAQKMLTALDIDAYQNTEVLEWTFRGKHHYKWFKKKGYVEISWDDIKVILYPTTPSTSEVYVKEKKVINKELLNEATNYFNNDSFWLVAPYKVFDKGTERRIVNYKNKEALLITYTTGGTTPGDSYLWILDDTFKPISYKMWTKIIPIGGVEASWNDWVQTEAGIPLPQKHKLSLFGMQLDMGTVKAYNEDANKFAATLLKAIHHEQYKATNTLRWSFGGKRFYTWDKKNHIVNVSWDTISVQLFPNQLKKSKVFIHQKQLAIADMKTVAKAERFFNNDSFWLVAPHKLFEKGIIRTLKKEGNKELLLVTYTKGGTTPGDSYLWELDTNTIPKSYKMYVPSMNMKGVTATWEDWITTESGTLLPTSHTFSSGSKLSMGNVTGTK